MRKIMVLLLLSVLASTAALASTSTNLTYGDGYLWTGSTWAMAETVSDFGAQDLEARVTLEYKLNGNTGYANDSTSDYRSSVSASASIPSGATPIEAYGSHRITLSNGASYSGGTSYNY